MKFRPVITSLLLACASAGLTSCFSSSKVNTKNETSVGQQLSDLDNAYRRGIITEKEYLKLKKAIIKAND
ncbi:hypothetical protein JIN84_07445 [Luteolibacter yonseiensis]|uniref:SHOCT domain-containing protein n=1 Tax=Luteolibacter yonseiensis TaxID=1144680 RepID=A0A934R276_9BACT|nr:SHOCT domain-containing protein [Luteolibacter yonseiensis]MBK1815442.1 hypothetical protein [Luteolibacter yonseiensis]